VGRLNAIGYLFIEHYVKACLTVRSIDVMIHPILPVLSIEWLAVSAFEYLSSLAVAVAVWTMVKFVAALTIRVLVGTAVDIAHILKLC